jgi:hypothetical protein
MADFLPATVDEELALKCMRLLFPPLGGSIDRKGLQVITMDMIAEMRPRV